LTRISNVREISKFKRSIKAISPVIATLLMIAIAVVASLVVYAWVTGYMGNTTSKAGKAIQIQSFAVDGSNNLHVYVQNVGQGTTQLSAVYVDNVLKASPNDVIPEGNTAELVINGPYDTNTKLSIKVTTTDGTFMTSSGKPGSGGSVVVVPAIALSPVSGPSATTVTVTGTGFAATSAITVRFNSVVMTTSPASVTTSAGGAFSCTFAVPAIAAGAYTVSATDASSGTDSDTFTVTTVAVPLALDGSISSSVTTGNTITLTLVTSNANDVLYLSWVGNGGDRSITGVSSSGTSGWTQRARISADNDHWLETWYATRTTAGTTTITITMSSNNNGDCAAVAYGISGADLASPFDGNRRTNTGTNDGSGSVTISTSNANDFILGAIGVDNAPTLTTGSGFTLIRSQAVGTSRITSDEYKIVSTTQSNLAVGYSFSSTEDWAMVVEAIKKAP
jgi:flagellin-like protein